MPNCTICGQELDDSPIAAPSHARKHRNEFEDICGRRPESYDEVRSLFNDGELPDDVDADVGTPTKLTDYVEGVE